MSDEGRQFLCIPSTPGLQTLVFPDGCRVSVTGLAEILADVRAEGRPAGRQAAEEILRRLEVTNYIPAAGRQEYCDVLLKEYARYLKGRSENAGKDDRA